MRLVLIAVGSLLAAGCMGRAGQQSVSTSAPTASSPVGASTSAQADSFLSLSDVSGSQLDTLLADGTIVRVDGDRVTVFDSAGELIQSSLCYGYTEKVVFMAALQRALVYGTHDDVLDLVQFPLYWHHDGTEVLVANRAQLVEVYDQVFAAANVRGVLSNDPRLVFCRNGGFMLGNGELWAGFDSSPRPGVVTVNG